VVSQPSFGRRVTVQSQSRIARIKVEAVKQGGNAASGETPLESPLQPFPANPGLPSVEQELLEWRRGRQGFKVPWRPLSLMASLCFGIASLVLPASLNDNVQWLLYALMAASLYAGFSKRRRQANRPPV
jgi:hypothetical protein